MKIKVDVLGSQSLMVSADAKQAPLEEEEEGKGRGGGEGVGGGGAVSNPNDTADRISKLHLIQSH